MNANELNDQLQSIADNNFTDTKNYLKELAEDKVNQSLANLNDEIDKATGIQGTTMLVGGLYAGGRGTLKAYQEASKYYKKKFSNTENQGDIKDNVNNLDKETIEPAEDVETSIRDSLKNSLKSFGLDENQASNILNTDEVGKNLGQRPSLRDIQESIENTPAEEYKFSSVESVKDDTQLGDMDDFRPLADKLQTGETSDFLDNASDFISKGATKIADVGSKVAEVGSDIAGGVGDALGVVSDVAIQAIPFVNVISDIAMLGFLGDQVYKGIKEGKKKKQADRTYENNLKRVNDIDNMVNTNPITTAPLQQKSNLLQGGETASF